MPTLYGLWLDAFLTLAGKRGTHEQHAHDADLHHAQPMPSETLGTMLTVTCPSC